MHALSKEIEHMEVIGSCGGDEKNEWPRRTDKNQTLEKKVFFCVYI